MSGAVGACEGRQTPLRIEGIRVHVFGALFVPDFSTMLIFVLRFVRSAHA